MLGEHKKHRQKILRKTSAETLERKGQKGKINRKEKEGKATLTTSFLLLFVHPHASHKQPHGTQSWQ